MTNASEQPLLSCETTVCQDMCFRATSSRLCSHFSIYICLTIPMSQRQVRILFTTYVVITCVPRFMCLKPCVSGQPLPSCEARSPQAYASLYLCLTAMWPTRRGCHTLTTIGGHLHMLQWTNVPLDMCLRSTSSRLSDTTRYASLAHVSARWCGELPPNESARGREGVPWHAQQWAQEYDAFLKSG